MRPAEDEQYDTVLAHPQAPSLFLELHFGLETASQRVTALDPVTVWSYRQPAVVAGTPAFVLPQDVELVVLAAHGGKPHHGFVRLVWIAEIAMIVRAASDDESPSTGSASAPSPSPPTASPSWVPRSPWRGERASTRRSGCFHFRSGAGEVRPWASCSR